MLHLLYILSFIYFGIIFTFAIGVLETEWKENLTKSKGIKLATKAVRSALIRDIASGNGIDIIIT